MPLPSSTALSTLTGWAGLTAEQALIASAWRDTALAEAIPSEARAKAARPAVIVVTNDKDHLVPDRDRATPHQRHKEPELDVACEAARR
jgi:predicted nuclease of predicted toxin-antitoxin system